MAHSKKTVLELGLFVIPVRLEVAVDDESADMRTVCTGDGTHDPVRIKQHVECPSCDKSATSHWGFPERGVERDGKMILLTAEDIKEAAGDPIKRMALSFHPREKVYAATVAGDSVQNIVPDRGGEKGYVALRDALRAHADMVAVTVWAPSTKNALWIVEVVDDRLVASKRAWPEDVRPAPAIAPAEVTAQEADMLETFIVGSATDFDVSEYRNAARDGMETLIASRLGDAVSLPASTTGGATVSDSGDMLAALQASLDQVAKATTRTAKKAVAKKTAAKKTTAKKTTAKKAATPRKKVA